MRKNLVIIPTYNEKENVGRMIHTIFSLPTAFDLLIVDDGSPDGTGTIVKQLQKEYPDRLFLEERTGKMGLGTAYIHGFKWGLERHYEYLFEMDCDFSHNPKDLIRLHKECTENGFDLAIGSRYAGGVINVVNWPVGRVMLSFFASKYVKMVTGLAVADSTAGFICYHRNVLETINLDKIKFIGYAFQIEMKFKAWKHGFKIQEIPVIFTDRTHGESKMSTDIFNEALFGVIQLKWKSLFTNYKKAASKNQ